MQYARVVQRFFYLVSGYILIPMRSVGYQRSDQRVIEDVNDRLFLDPYVDASDVEVHVEKGDVTLTGLVADKNAKRLAEDIAWSVAGVKNVDNKLRVAKTHVAGPVRSHDREQLI